MWAGMGMDGNRQPEKGKKGVLAQSTRHLLEPYLDIVETADCKK